MHDVIIIGGSYAGLSAALQLARGRRDVLIIDGGERRNRFALEAHGLLTQDGSTPAAIQADGLKQVLAYPNARYISSVVTSAERVGDGFAVIDRNGVSYEGKRLLLAIGVRDDLPKVEGITERWGQRVFHCPYCHGYELDQGSIGVLAVSPNSFHQALLLPDWGPTTFFLNGVFEPDEAQTVQLARRGVTIEATPIARFAGENADVELIDGRTVKLVGMFTASRTSPSSPLAAQLGCGIEEGPNGQFITTDFTKETSVLGVFAVGDAARAMGSVALAVGDGAMAGAGVHRSLIFGEM